MIVICNSAKDIAAHRVRQGDAFVFGKSGILLNADYIILTDLAGCYVLRKQDIVWPEIMEGATHVIKTHAMSTLRRSELEQACPKFNAAVHGTLAFRNTAFERKLSALSYMPTEYGVNNGPLSCA
ncbi:hypothetical protein fHeYen902_183 [Yersinia phage fHe-Yen9-02]|nr:hypothetical protein fHeYen902_183 [Yersinia phage fHe-Yen9-02]